MPCPRYLGDLSGTHTGNVYPYLTPDLSTLVIRSSGEVSRYSWQDLTLIDELTISGGDPIGVDNSNIYRHSGFNLTSFPLGSTTGTNIGTTAGGGGLTQPVLLAGDGNLYLLEDRTAGPRLWMFSTSGAASSPGTNVVTFTGYNAATRDFFGDGNSIWLPLRNSTTSVWHLVHFDIGTLAVTDLGALADPASSESLAGVLNDGTLVAADASDDLIQINPDVGGASYSSTALCPTLPQGYPTNVNRQGSFAVGVINESTVLHVYVWPGPGRWWVGVVGWGQGAGQCCANGTMIWDGTQGVTQTGDSGDPGGFGITLEPSPTTNCPGFTVDSLDDGNGPVYYLTGMAGTFTLAIQNPDDVNPDWDVRAGVIDVAGFDTDTDPFFGSAPVDHTGIVSFTIAADQLLVVVVYGNGATASAGSFSLTFDLCEA